MLKPLTVKSLAARHGTTERTLYRLAALKVDIHDPLAVARYLASSQNPTVASLLATARELENELTA